MPEPEARQHNQQTSDKDEQAKNWKAHGIELLGESAPQGAGLRTKNKISGEIARPALSRAKDNMEDRYDLESGPLVKRLGFSTRGGARSGVKQRLNRHLFRSKRK